MAEQQQMESALGCYRVLDLTQGGCLLCGRLLADLGADVIKIERPRGDPSRNIGPFYKDILHPEKSLYWFAYNTNKRSITLDIETCDGQQVFKRLAQSADFVIESFLPGYLDSLGLGYSALSEVNPRIIMTSITPFGQSGPYAHYKASDITLWAMGGFMYLAGDPDRPPVWISIPQAYLNAAAEGAAASMIAHWHREQTGEGQHVDVSVQERVIQLFIHMTPYWAYNQFIVRRVGYGWTTPNASHQMGYECQDGHVTYQIWGGGDASAVGSTKAMIAWMDEEGAAPDWLKGIDWVRDYDAMTLTQDLVDRVEGTVAEFIKTRTKRELYEQAVKRRIMLAPVSTAKDLLENEQLAAREFWTSLEHPELDDAITYCGPFVKMSETPCKLERRAPLIGEHNEEIYQQELGFSAEQLATLKQARVI